MTQHTDSANLALEIALPGFQTFQVVFLWIHDWIPLGRLNDVAAVRNQDTLRRRVIVTLVQSVPFSIVLVWSAWYFGRPYPHGLDMWLWIIYGASLVGYLRAWWVPYLVCADPNRATRYQIMFGNTHSFLPQRNGLSPNTAHILLQLATAGTLLALWMRDFKR
jgi:hypothetical protein